MHFGDLSEVPFPAVSICHPKSWKWPGLVKAITHFDTYGDAFFIIKKLNMYQNASLRLNAINAMRLMNEEFLGEDRTFDDEHGVIESIDRLFPKDGLIRDFIYWLLNLWYSIKDNENMVEKIDGVFVDAFCGNEMANGLENDNIVNIKNKICQTLNCTFTDNVKE